MKLLATLILLLLPFGCSEGHESKTTHGHKGVGLRGSGTGLGLRLWTPAEMDRGFTDAWLDSVIRTHIIADTVIDTSLVPCDTLGKWIGPCVCCGQGAEFIPMQIWEYDTTITPQSLKYLPKWKWKFFDAWLDWQIKHADTAFLNRYDLEVPHE